MKVIFVLPDFERRIKAFCAIRLSDNLVFVIAWVISTIAMRKATKVFLRDTNMDYLI